MKKRILFFASCLSILNICSIQAQAPNLTLLVETSYTEQAKPTQDGNYIAASSPGSWTLDINVTKLDPEGNILWSNSLETPPDYENPRDIYELSDGSIVVFKGNAFLKFNSSGEYLPDNFMEIKSTELGFDPIPGDYDNHYYISTEQVGDDFILLTKCSAGAPTNSNFFTLTKIDGEGNSLWSYSYLMGSYEYLNDFELNGELAYVHLTNYSPGFTKLILINCITGDLISEHEYDYDQQDKFLLNINTGILKIGSKYELDQAKDVLTKYDYDGNLLWTKEFEYPIADSAGGILHMLQKESGFFISCNLVPDGTGSEIYALRYYNESCDTFLQVNDFLDIEYFSIHSMVSNGENLIFSGGYYDLGWDSDGFVLITDTLGNFFQLTLNGNVYYDENDNGVLDAEEYTFQNTIITSDPNTYYGVTNEDGEYLLRLYNPGTYTIAPILPEYWDLVDPDTYEIVFSPMMDGDTIFNKDFRFDYTVPIQDLSINVCQGGLVPGFTSGSYITVENIGNQVTSDIIIQYHVPNGMSYVTGDPYTDYTDTTITWEITDLPIDVWYSVYAAFTASLDYELGEEKTFIGTVAPILADFAPENNIDTVIKTVVESCDPNHKTVNPAGFSEEGYINPNTEWLEYTIEFQNIGNAPATFVNIVDIIDSDLDLTSIQILGAKHNYWMEITGTNNIIWHFENINLPDSASDPLGSCGFITYKIKIKDEATIGTVITNTAYIYFDYNEAVITNTTKTTLELPNSNQEYNKYLNVYPNPAGDHIILQLEEENTSGYNIKIYNINGEVVLNEVLDAGKQMIQINSANLPNGIYFINCSGNDGSLKTNAKVIITH